MKFNSLLSVIIALFTMTGINVFGQQQLQATPQPTQTNAPQKKQKLTADQRADLEVSRVDAIVHLTDDQKTQLKQLYTNVNQQREQNKATAAGDKDKLRELNKDLGRQRKDGQNKILTSDQQALLKQQKQQNKGQQMQLQQVQPQPGK